MIMSMLSSSTGSSPILKENDGSVCNGRVGSASLSSITDRLWAFRRRVRRCGAESNHEKSSEHFGEFVRSPDNNINKKKGRDEIVHGDNEEEEDERDLEIDALRFANEILLQQLKEQRQNHRKEREGCQQQFAQEVSKLQTSMQQGIQACFAQITELKQQLQLSEAENQRLVAALNQIQNEI